MRILRVLAILTKRQLTDDGVYLLTTLLAMIGIVLAGAILAFFSNPDVGFNLYLPVPTVGLLAAVLLLLCIGSHVLGTVQADAAQQYGIYPFLRVLPVGRGQIVLAQVMTTSIFLLVVFAFLTFIVSVAVLLDLLPGRSWLERHIDDWPPSFLMDLAVWTFFTAVLVALTCYCLGRLKAGTSSIWLAAASSLPVTLVLLMLVLIKGLSVPLVIILALLTTCSLMRLLAGPRSRGVTAAATGLTACVFIVVPLFCARHLCDATLAACAASKAPLVETRSSDLISLERESNRPPVATGGINEDHRLIISHRTVDLPNVPFLLGIVDSITSRLPRHFTIYSSSSGYSRSLYFDDSLGQLVNRFRRATFCVGPEGVASTPDERLGRFASPIFGDGVLYDRRTRRFYRVDSENGTVCKGEQLEDPTLEPVYIFPGVYERNMCWVAFRDALPAYESGRAKYAAILDQCGHIYLLDRRTLRVLRHVGNLPRPPACFGRGWGRPQDLLGYDVSVITGTHEATDIRVVAGSISRQGTSMALAVFDKDGRLLGESGGGSSSPAALLLPKYLVESLHPPVLTLASFFTAYRFEAGATHRSLFLMPNSFVALQRDRETSGILQFLWALVFLTPAMLFSGLLGWRVVRDAAALGFPGRVRGLWLAGTLAFGLPAYLTYRLLRPQVVTAPCRDCGAARRVDRDLCHRCGRGWERPMLDPPAWRILDSAA